MYQGTTPSIPIRFEGINLMEAKVIISLYDEQKKIRYDYESGKDFMIHTEGDDSVTELSMTQDQTLNLGTGLISIQARYIYSNGSCGATQRASIQMQSVLNKEVISYDG